MKPYKPSSSSLLPTLCCRCILSAPGRVWKAKPSHSGLLGHPEPSPRGGQGRDIGTLHPAAPVCFGAEFFRRFGSFWCQGEVRGGGGARSPHTPLKAGTQHSGGTQPCRVPPQSPVRGHGLTPGRWAAPSPWGRGRAGGSEQPHGQNRVAPMGKPGWVGGRQPGTFPGAGRAGREGWGVPSSPTP